jgi:hypothetical protein
MPELSVEQTEQIIEARRQFLDAWIGLGAANCNIYESDSPEALELRTKAAEAEAERLNAAATAYEALCRRYIVGEEAE